MNNTLESLKIPINNKVIAFHHIPKTAGTNFTYIIENNYKHFCVKNNFSYIDRNTNKLVCAFGHAGFQTCFRHNCIMFVFLRNPIERVISHFVEHKNNRYIPKELTLEEIFLQKSEIYIPSKKYPLKHIASKAGYNGNALWASNFYCRALSGNGFYGNTPYPITKINSEAVVSNIKNNNVVYKRANGANVVVPTIFGITERFSESINLFAKIAGWKTTKYVEKSAGRAYNKGRRKYNASNELINEIKKHNLLDLRIYNNAVKVFENQLEFFK